MRFWDASAIVPLVLVQPDSERARSVLEADEDLVVWWGTPVECQSAIARLERTEQYPRSRRTTPVALRKLRRGWGEIAASDDMRERAHALLLRHPLRAGDALQLAAALTWAEWSALWSCSLFARRSSDDGGAWRGLRDRARSGIELSGSARPRSSRRYAGELIGSPRSSAPSIIRRS